MDSHTGVCEHCGAVVNFYSTTAGPYRGYSNSYNLDGSAHLCRPQNAGPLFDLEAGEEEKEKGMQRAASPEYRQYLLLGATRRAETIAKRKGRVTADDVVEWYSTIMHINLPLDLGNAIGCIFKSKHLTWTGETAKSKRPGRHGNMGKVWEYKA